MRLAASIPCSVHVPSTFFADSHNAAHACLAASFITLAQQNGATVVPVVFSFWCDLKLVGPESQRRFELPAARLQLEQRT